MHKQKGAVEIVLVVVLILAVVTLFAPIPFYQGPTDCEPNQIDCPKEGWRFGPSLSTKLLWEVTRPEQSTTSSVEKGTISPIETTTLDPMTDWQIHKDKTGTFEIKIPKGWRVAGESSQSIELTLHSPYAIIKDPGFLDKGSLITVNEVKNPQDVALRQWWQEQNFAEEPNQIIIGGQDGFIFHGLVGPRKISHAAVAWQGKVIHFFGESTDQQGFTELFTQILSTFRFD